MTITSKNYLLLFHLNFLCNMIEEKINLIRSMILHNFPFISNNDLRIFELSGNIHIILHSNNKEEEIYLDSNSSISNFLSEFYCMLKL